MRRYAAIAGACLFAFALLFLGVWTLSRSRTYQLFGEIVPRVETTEKVVALTFDDGPVPEATEEILGILRERDVKATFFVTGAELEENPEWGRRIAEEGHELGNHSYSHARMVFVSDAFVRDEVERTDALIRQTGYGGPVYFRPPYCKKLVGLPRYLSETNRKTITCDLEPDSYDDVAATAEGIESYVVDRARPGSIVLLHVMYPTRRTSMAAVPRIVDALRARGYRFVTVGELLHESHE
jgi:peptidoglycan-N-acetylglucosamine deacetylase